MIKKEFLILPGGTGNTVIIIILHKVSYQSV